MFNNKLKVGDYVFTADGILYRIVKVNKLTYTAKDTRGAWTELVPFDGIKQFVEFFECDEPQKKALELAIETHRNNKRMIEEANEAREFIGKAKYFLRHVKELLEEIKDVEEIEPRVDFK